MNKDGGRGNATERGRKKGERWERRARRAKDSVEKKKRKRKTAIEPER